MLRNDAKKLSSKRAEMQTVSSEFQDRIRSGELREEEDITSRLLERIGSTLTFSEGDLRVVTKAITVGKQKEEPVSGADIAVVSIYQSPRVVITKGFLAQAKNLNLQQKMYQPGWGRLQNQCKKMLARTNESYVWLYSGTSLRVHKANAVGCLKSQTVDDLPYMYLKTFLIDYLICHHGDGMMRVEIKGVDIFDPTTGEVKSSDNPADDIACWFIDDDYDEESFFVRHAYFLGGASGDPYKALKRALKAEIDEEAWATLHTTLSYPFPRPESGQICVKVINHFGDEVQKVFNV